MGSEDIEICTGNVLRDVSGEENMVVFIRFTFEGALDDCTKDQIKRRARISNKAGKARFYP